MLTFSDIINSAKNLDDHSEEALRYQLACLYRIFYHYEWCDLIVTHLSVRVPNEDALLINPFGLAFNEIYPEHLIKVSFTGEIIDSPMGFDINKNGTTVHRAIYAARPDLNCLLHTHSTYGVAVSNLKTGLLCLDQISMMFRGVVGLHRFDTLFINDNSQDHLIDDLKGNQCMVLQNHGLLSVGESIAEAFWYHYYLEQSCEKQILSMSASNDLHLPPREVVEETAERYANWKHDTVTQQLSDSKLLFEAAKRQVKIDF